MFSTKKYSNLLTCIIKKWNYSKLNSVYFEQKIHLFENYKTIQININHEISSKDTMTFLSLDYKKLYSFKKVWKSIKWGKIIIF